MNGNFKEDIKFNCDVSDAQYWGYFSICGLLLRYRDLYRSELGLGPWTSIDRKEIAEWIQAKETQWPALENREFRDLTIGGESFDPFDADAINQTLDARGLVYGAGYGMYMKPTFFLAELRSRSEISGLSVHKSGRELVRDLLTAPAMLQNNSIYIRYEPLQILLHFKLSELNTRENSALERSFAAYGFSHRQLIDNTLEKRIEQMAERYAEIILQHEIAEHRETIPGWKDILSAAADRKNEHYLRALKDLIADTSDAGPFKMIVRTEDTAALGLSVALLEGFHRLLFPEIKKAYDGFLQNGDWNVIEQTRTRAYTRLVSERERVVQLFKSSSPEEFARSLRESLSV